MGADGTKRSSTISWSLIEATAAMRWKHDTAGWLPGDGMRRPEHERRQQPRRSGGRAAEGPQIAADRGGRKVSSSGHSVPCFAAGAG